mgnify:CR=1 FL=1
MTLLNGYDYLNNFFEKNTAIFIGRIFPHRYQLVSLLKKTMSLELSLTTQTELVKGYGSYDPCVCGIWPSLTQVCIYYSWFTFLTHTFMNYSTITCIGTIHTKLALWTFLICLWRLFFCANPTPQSSHLNGLSPVCIRSWTTSFLGVGSTFPQNLQVCLANQLEESWILDDCNANSAISVITKSNYFLQNFKALLVIIF